MTMNGVFGVWKQPTGKKRCQRFMLLNDSQLHECIRPAGHGGYCGPMIFPTNRYEEGK